MTRDGEHSTFHANIIRSWHETENAVSPIPSIISSWHVRGNTKSKFAVYVISLPVQFLYTCALTEMELIWIWYLYPKKSAEEEKWIKSRHFIDIQLRTNLFCLRERKGVPTKELETISNHLSPDNNWYAEQRQSWWLPLVSLETNRG